jgi:hypothetical protein
MKSLVEREWTVHKFVIPPSTGIESLAENEWTVCRKCYSPQYWYEKFKENFIIPPSTDMKNLPKICGQFIENVIPPQN